MTNGLYGRPTAQPYFRFSELGPLLELPPGTASPGATKSFPGTGPATAPESLRALRRLLSRFVVHRPSDWYASADFAPLTIDYGSDISVAQHFLPAVPAVPGIDNNVPPDGDFTDPGDVLPIAAIPAAVGPSVLSTGDFRPEFNAGGKYTVGRRIFDCYRIEGTYLGWYEWESSAIARDPAGNLSSILGGFVNPPDPIFDNNTEIFIAQQARMWSAEANLRYWIDMPPGPFDVSCLVGARYMSIDDRFRLHSTNLGGLENDVLSETENKMIGVQIGVAGDFLIHPRYWINVDLKGGMYNNEITLNYNLDSFAPGEDRVFAGFRSGRPGSASCRSSATGKSLRIWSSISATRQSGSTASRSASRTSPTSRSSTASTRRRRRSSTTAATSSITARSSACSGSGRSRRSRLPGGTWRPG